MDARSQSSFIAKACTSSLRNESRIGVGGGETTKANTYRFATLGKQASRAILYRRISVERTWLFDHEGTELQHAIEDVVFAKLDEVQKEGYSSFRELRKAREAASNIQKESMRGEMAFSAQRGRTTSESVDQKHQRYRAKAESEKQAEELKKQLPDATQSVDKKVLEDLEKQQGSTFTKLTIDVSSRTRKRRAIETALESFSTVKKSTNQEISSIQLAIFAVFRSMRQLSTH